MKIGIASDHRGFDLKQKLTRYLKDKGYYMIDYGTNAKDDTDFPDYAILLSQKLIDKEHDLGIAICGSGIGMSIACNKVKGIRCAKIDNVNEAKMAKEHNNANVIAISANHDLKHIIAMINCFLKASFSKAKKYQRRNDKITAYETGNINEC